MRFLLRFWCFVSRLVLISIVLFSVRLIFICLEYLILISIIFVVLVCNFSGFIVCRMLFCCFVWVRDNLNFYINDFLWVFFIYEKGEIIVFVWEWEMFNKILIKIFLNFCICKILIWIWFKIYYKVKKYFKWMKVFFLN